MTITTLQVQGSDAAKKTVPLDTPTGKTYSAPIHKVGFGAESSLSLVSSDNPFPVTVESAELPAGAATSANQTTANEILAAIESVVATQATLASVLSKLAGGLPAALGTGGGLKIDGSGTAVPVNLIPGQTGISAGAGNSDATTIRIVTAEDDDTLTYLNALTDALGADDINRDPEGKSGMVIMGTVTSDEVDDGDAGCLAMTTARELKISAAWLSDLIETRVQTPTKTQALNVQIGPGDVISNIPVMIDYPHHQVHEGEAFIFSDLQTGGLNVAATRDIRVSVGALTATTRTPHLIVEFIADALAEIEIYEGTTWTSGGTAQVAYNRNRNVADDSGTLYVNGATALTVNAIGTPVWKGMTTGTKNSAGGTDRGAYEFVLKASTEYCVRVTSRTTGLKFLTRLEYYKDLGV